MPRNLHIHRTERCNEYHTLKDNNGKVHQIRSQPDQTSLKSYTYIKPRAAAYREETVPVSYYVHKMLGQVSPRKPVNN